MPKYYVNVTHNGTFWYKDARMGVLHREGGPAVECSDGTREWWVNGKRHREDGPAVELTTGTRMWCRDGGLHRDDGPAVECFDGIREWWVNGLRHREDGPAIDWNGTPKEWYLNGKRLTEEEFIKQTQPAVELTVAEIERLLGKRVKIVK